MINNIPFRLQTYMAPSAIKYIEAAGAIADSNVENLFLVGGAVRDLFLDTINFDIDLVIEGNALQIASELCKKENVRLISHSNFGTAKIHAEGLTIDIVSARREQYKRPGALPTVFMSNINDDLFRRDFTVNAMAIQINGKYYGRLIDPYDGIKDLEKRLIRIIHRDSFIDDATRIFRAIRYEQRLDFKIEKQTLQSIKENIDMIDTISPDRIKHELVLFLCENYPENSIQRANKLNVLKKVYPFLKAAKRTAKRFERARRYIGKSHLQNIYLCLLIYDLNEMELSGFIERYNFTRQQRESMLQTLSLKSLILSKRLNKIKHLELFKLLKSYNSTAIYTNIIGTNSEKTRLSLNFYISRLKNLRPRLTGRDLLDMGVPPGPDIGICMDKLMEARITGSIKSRKDEEKYITNLFNGTISH